MATRRGGPAAAIVLLLALISLAVAPGAGAVTLTVGATPSSTAIPSGFLGISSETTDLESYTGTNPREIDPAFVNLLGDIAPGQSPVPRIGGDSTDWSWYPVPHQPRPPGVTYTITNRWLDVARATADALGGKLILGVNLEADSRADAVGEADAMVKQIGRNDIDAIEIGNEPELYTHFAWYRTKAGRPVLGRNLSTWDPAAYRAQFAQFAQAMPKVNLAGPTSGLGTWLEQLGTFVQQERSAKLITIHAYPLKHCTPSHVITVPEVLANSASAGFVAEVAPYVAIARRAGTPIRIDEVNAISCGGTAGVSDSFATALWMLNTLFGLAETGVSGINVHTVPNTINAILNPVTRQGHPAIAVQPEYYAMMMFAQAAPPGSRIVQLSGGLPSGLEAWATRDDRGTVRVVLINKNAQGTQPASLHVPAAAGPATLERLQAPSLTATSGVTLGGQSFGTATGTGRLAGPASESVVTPLAGAYSVDVPAASAALLTLSAPPGRLLLTALSEGELLEPLMSSW